MGKERIAMTGDSLNKSLSNLLPKLEPDLSGLAITPSGEIVNTTQSSLSANIEAKPASGTNNEAEHNT